MIQKEHETIKDSIMETLQEKTVSQALDGNINTKVTCRLDGHIEEIEVYYNVSSGKAVLHTQANKIETVVRDDNGTLTHRSFDMETYGSQEEPERAEVRNKLEGMFQHLKNQHEALR